MKKLFLLKSIILMVAVSFLMTGVSFAQKKMSTEEFEIEKLKIERDVEKDKVLIEQSIALKKEELKIKADAEVAKKEAEAEKAKFEAKQADANKAAKEMEIAADVEKEKAKIEAGSNDCAGQNQLITGITVLNTTNSLAAFRDITLGLKELGNFEIKMGSKNAIDQTPKFQISISNPKFMEKSLELAPYEDKGLKWPLWAAPIVGVGAGSVAWLATFEDGQSVRSQMVAGISCGVSAAVLSFIVSILTQ